MFGGLIIGIIAHVAWLPDRARGPAFNLESIITILLTNSFRRTFRYGIGRGDVHVAERDIRSVTLFPRCLFSALRTRRNVRNVLMGMTSHGKLRLIGSHGGEQEADSQESHWSTWSKSPGGTGDLEPPHGPMSRQKEEPLSTPTQRWHQERNIILVHFWHHV